jgi:hypothetical protein
MSIKDLKSHELINELQSRGYHTELLFNLWDVEERLDRVNDEREEDYKINLTEEEKSNVLHQSINSSYYIQRINESISEHIEDYSSF